MKILVIGSGGREHALTWKLRESASMEEIYCAPGNAGIAQDAECLPVDLTSPAAILEVANSIKADLTVVGPEAPLTAGVVDEFSRAGRQIIGPTMAAARLEGSKVFAKQFMMRHSIPAARFVAAETFEQAVKALQDFAYPLVIKADGLAAGKGVVIVRERGQAEHVLDEFMRRKTLGESGATVLIEECLTGDELSLIILTDGRCVFELPPAQDHKRLLDDDQGPNTGGMGAFSDDSILSGKQRSEILSTIVRPTLAGISAEGAPFRGFLYFGLMLTATGPKLLEYNVRLGDPEAQAILMRMRSDLADILSATLNGALGSLGAHWSPNPSVCVVAASRGYPGTPEVGQVVTGHDAAESIGGVKVFHAGTKVTDHQLLTASGRVLSVCAVGEDLPVAIERAYSAMEKIHFDGMQFRRDIGAKGLMKPPAIRRLADPPLRTSRAAPAAPKLP